MEKWKLVVITLLLGGLVGYGVFQSRPQAQVPLPPPGSTPIPQPTPIMQGQPAIAWDITKENWANTPQPISLEDVKGNVTLIEFWRAECSHCQEAAPFMQSLYEKYSSQGLKMVTFHSPGKATPPDSLEGDWQKVQGKIKEWGIKYPVAFDQGGQLFSKYGGSRYPTVMLLNRNGEVEYFETGHTPEKEKTLISEIEKLLKAK